MDKLLLIILNENFFSLEKKKKGMFQNCWLSTEM